MLRIFISAFAVASLAAGCSNDCFVDGVGCENIVPRFTSIAAGRAHTCAVTEHGDTLCWGKGAPDFGEIYGDTVYAAGDSTCLFSRGAETARCVGPAADVDESLRLLAMGLSSTHGCAIKHDYTSETSGVLTCWGEGIATIPTRFYEVAPGVDHTCGIGEQSQAVCFGNNDRNQARPPVLQFHHVVSGDGFSCGLVVGRSFVECWGDVPAGTPSESGFLDLAAGPRNACAIRADGSIVCWGDDAMLQQPPTSSESFHATAVGDHHACALDGEGHAICWGANDEGQTTPP